MISVSPFDRVSVQNSGCGQSPVLPRVRDTAFDEVGDGLAAGRKKAGVSHPPLSMRKIRLSGVLEALPGAWFGHQGRLTGMARPPLTHVNRRVSPVGTQPAHRRKLADEHWQ